MSRTADEVTPGLVVVDKPAGMTSHDVVSRVRRLAGTRKVGHAGTLDPMATGVLVLGIGRATRLLGHLQLNDKRYDATVRLGASTHTDDAEGEVLATTDASALTGEDVRAALTAYVGPLQQVPTAVSAIKVDGRRAHERVRAGEEVRLRARPVTVHALDVLDVRLGATCEVDVSLHCSSGTYVRAIARDVGADLGVGGHLAALRRTAVGGFTLAAARTLDELAGELTVLDLTEAAAAAFPTVRLDAAGSADVRYGRKLPLSLGEVTAVLDDTGAFLALYEPAGPELARAVAVFV